MLDDQTAAGYDEPLDFSALLAGDEFQNSTTNFTAVNAASGTVSPQDLFLDQELPPPDSNALTNLTTPSLYDFTPDMTDSYDVSPAFGTKDLSMDNWPPLFSDYDDAFGTAQLDDSEPPSLTSSTTSLANHKLDLARTPSNISNIGDDILRHRLSLTAGITKPSRRSLKNLSPIEVNDGDETAVKRARNTMAARKSRQKKRDVEDGLRLALEAMTAERDHWRMVAVKYGAPVPEP